MDSKKIRRIIQIATLLLLLMPIVPVNAVDQSKESKVSNMSPSISNGDETSNIEEKSNTNKIRQSNFEGSDRDRHPSPLRDGLGDGIVSIHDLILQDERYKNDPEMIFERLKSSHKESYVKVKDDKMRVILKVDNSNTFDMTNYLQTQYDFEFLKNHNNIDAIVGYLPVDHFDFKLGNSFLSQMFNSIEYIEPDYLIQSSYIPDDPEFNNQYGLTNMFVDRAWDTTLGNNSIKVAIIDTGIDYLHPDLMDNYLSIGYDHVNNDSDPMDDHGHGTHVAGTVAASINNAIGVAGVANVSIFAEKILNDTGSGFSSDSAAGIDHAVAAGADILSNSWGAFFPSSIVETAINNALAANVTIIAAAGNTASSVEHYPAAFDGVIAVGSTTSDNTLSYFSNFGDWVDVVAPGSNILSTQLGGGYHYLSGTSMATPHVSGVAALVLSQLGDVLPNELELILENTAIDLGDAGKDNTFGHGLVNASSAIHGLDNNDLKATFSEIDILPINVNNTLSAGVTNIGYYNQTNVTVSVEIDGIEVASQFFSNISSFQTKTFEFYLTPTELRTYNFDIIVSTVTNETNIANNNLTVLLEVTSPRFTFEPGTFHAYIDTQLNPFAIKFTYHEQLNASYINMSITVSILMGEGFEPSYGVMNIFTGNLYDPNGQLDTHPFLIPDLNYEVGDRVDIEQYGDQAGLVTSTTASHNYRGHEIPSYEIAVNNRSYFYHKETGFLGFSPDEKDLELDGTNKLPTGFSISDLTVDIQLMTTAEGIGNITGYVYNSGTTTQDAVFTIENDGVEIYRDTATLQSGELLSLISDGYIQHVQFTQTGLLQNITATANIVSNEILTSDNIYTRMIQPPLNEYYFLETDQSWEDMTGAEDLTLRTETEPLVSLPFEFRYFDILTSEVLVSDSGVLSFANDKMAFFGYAGGVSTNLLYSYQLQVYFPASSSNYYSELLYKEFGDRVVFEFQSTYITVQAVLHQSGLIEMNYLSYESIDGSVVTNQGSGVGQAFNYDIINPIANRTIKLYYNFDNAELETSFTDVPDKMGDSLNYDIKASVENLGDSVATDIPYTLYDNGTAIETGTVSVDAGSITELTFSYSTSLLGLHNFTLVIDNAPNEEISRNNMVTTTAKVVDKVIVMSFIMINLEHFGNESTIAGITVNVYKNDVFMSSGVTDSQGMYNFTEVFAGTYRIETVTSQYYNESYSLTTSIEIGNHYSITMRLQYVRTHYVELDYDQPSLDYGASEIHLNISYSGDFSYAEVFVDGDYRMRTTTSSFFLPFLQNGTHDVKVQTFWGYNYQLNNTFQITNNDLHPVYNLKVGDYMNYNYMKNYFVEIGGEAQQGTVNFTVIAQPSTYTYNISMEVLIYSSEGSVTNYTTYLLVSSLNGYIIDSGNSWLTYQFFIMQPMTIQDATNGTYIPSFSWSFTNYVNGSMIYENYAVTSFDGGSNVYDEYTFDSERSLYLNSSGLLYENYYVYSWAGYIYEVEWQLIESNLLEKPYIPVIDGPQDLELGLSDLDQLSWTIRDDNLVSYQLFLDQVEIASGTEAVLSYDISAFDLGSYNFTLVVIDADGHEVIIEYIINISDDILPIVDIDTTDIVYTVGDTGNGFQFTVTDNSTVDYLITLNNEVWDLGTMFAGTNTVGISVDGLDEGSYTFIISITDNEGNSVVLEVQVTVESIEEPEPTDPVSTPPDDTTPISSTPSDSSSPTTPTGGSEGGFISGFVYVFSLLSFVAITFVRRKYWN